MRAGLGGRLICNDLDLSAVSGFNIPIAQTVLQPTGPE